MIPITTKTNHKKIRFGLSKRTHGDNLVETGCVDTHLIWCKFSSIKYYGKRQKWINIENVGHLATLTKRHLEKTSIVKIVNSLCDVNA